MVKTCLYGGNMTGELVSIEGLVERVQYRNEANGFSVVWLDETEKGPVVMVGTLPGIREGDMVRAAGRWIVHAQYGEQFQAQAFTPLLPATLQGIERYLASGAVKGIGPKTAARLVAHFGVETLNVIENDPARLTELSGIGRAKAETIAASFASQQGIRTLMLFLENYGVSPAYAARIYKYYGEASVSIIRENPYRMADEMVGIGFKTADKIARQMGTDMHSPHRLASGLLYTLTQEAYAGHVFLPREIALAKAGEILETDELPADILDNLAAAKQIMLEEERVYLPVYYWSEQGIATRMVALKHSVASQGWELPSRLGESLSTRQKQAVELAMREGVVVITGGPGTGKTTTLRTILQVMEEAGRHVQLAAPTGRAAKRMAETTGYEAKTIHRLLEYSHADGGNLRFQRHAERPLEADVFIIDEVSMVDNQLMYSLLQAISEGTRLILVGDADQLPSVGPGSVLRDIVSSGAIPAIHLDEIFRQDQDGMIVVNAHRINGGELPLYNRPKGDFFLIEVADPRDIAAMVVDLCTRRLLNYYPCNPVEDIQVLAPMKRTTAGVDQLNRELQMAYNPPGANKPEVFHKDMVLRLGDKVMQIKNNYDKAVYNGDMGIITDIDMEEGQLAVRFSDREGDGSIFYDRAELEELTLAYAITVHKSQGSEFQVVVLVMTTQHHIMLQRNLLYTGVTRARSLVVLVGTQTAVAKAVRNNRESKRYTYLAERLKMVDGERWPVTSDR
jgi:exodeoxyribonuclease V alpha subunit